MFHVSHAPGHLQVLVAVTVSGRWWGRTGRLSGFEPRSLCSIHVGTVGSFSSPQENRQPAGVPQQGQHIAFE